MIDCAHGCASYCSARYCFAKAAMMAQLPNLSPFFDDFDKRMTDLNSEHVSETESDEEERTVAEGVEQTAEGVEQTAKKKKKKCRRKRRRAGDRLGCQMALRALEKEKKGRTNEEIVSEACPEPASFCRGDSGDPLCPR